MKIYNPLKKDRGAVLIVVTIICAGAAFAAGFYSAYSDARRHAEDQRIYMDKLQKGTEITEDDDRKVCDSIRHQFQSLGGGDVGRWILNSDEPPRPATGSPVHRYIEHSINDYTDRASNPRRPSSSKPLPTCMSGTFTCANGKIICANLVCNSTDNCGDNSDERSNICSTESSCCQSTNGCPGETGTSCAETCCCCPMNMICDRRNPANGCIRSQ